MKYYYICEECKNNKTIEQSIKDDLPKKVICSECGEKMIYDPNNFSSNIRIPYNMRATADISDNKVRKVHKKFY